MERKGYQLIPMVIIYLVGLFLISLFGLCLMVFLTGPAPDQTGTINKAIVIEIPEEVPLELRGVGVISGTFSPYGNEVAVTTSQGWSRHESFFLDSGGTYIATWKHAGVYFFQVELRSHTCYQIGGEVIAFSVNSEGDGHYYYYVTPCNIVSR